MTNSNQILSLAIVKMLKIEIKAGLLNKIWLRLYIKIITKKSSMY